MTGTEVGGQRFHSALKREEDAKLSSLEEMATCYPSVGASGLRDEERILLSNYQLLLILPGRVSCAGPLGVWGETTGLSYSIMPSF